MDNVARRNQDYHDISRRILFTSGDGISLDTIFDHDFLFWQGDLNYRVNLADGEVRRKLLQQELKPLLEADQLHTQRRLGAAFEEFMEGDIAFAPSYKFECGTSTYSNSEKNVRTPAWTDRVLWRKDIKNIKQTSYGSAIDIVTSDHKPVYASFEIKAKKLIHEMRQKVYQELVRQLDKLENESLPNCVMDKNSLEFPNIKYLSPVTKSVVMENQGKVVTKFQFIPKLDEQAFCKPWLWVNPPFGMLVPGEQTKINFTVHVDNSTAVDFNLAKQKLEDILILHLDAGTDFFVTISGSVLPSCFGSLLTHLVRFPGPVRQNQALPIQSPDCLSIPKEMWRIIDFIYRRGMDTVNLFLQSGVQREMEQIRECLDSGESFDSHEFDVFSMGEILIRFLDSLGEPVIPFHLFEQALGCISLQQAKQLLTGLPPVHHNVFYYLVSFLREVLVHSQQNKLTADKIAVVFSSVLLRTKTTAAGSVTPAIVRRKAEFLCFFLKSDRVTQQQQKAATPPPKDDDD